jgi:lipoprotein-anchoring transpeptidase ErfK/SrfK
MGASTSPSRGVAVPWPMLLAGAAAALTVGMALVDAQRFWAARSARQEAQAELSADSVGIRQALRTLRAADDSTRMARASFAPGDTVPFIIVSLTENRLWVRDGRDDIFTTRVATGSGRTLVGSGKREQYKFDTPRGKLTVRSKETSPAWVPPDWHFVEAANKRGLSVVRMKRGQSISAGSSRITTRGSEMIRRHADGSVEVLSVANGRELVVGGRMIIPPFGTEARRYKEILGTHRLNLGDGYALHGTNAPSTIGRSVSHGCVRLRNEDIETLYRMIPVGTTVFIY